MIAILSALTFTQPLIQDASDPMHLRGAAIHVHAGAGGDGLRNDSVLHVDLIYSDGTLHQVRFTHGIPDNNDAQVVAADKWRGPNARLAYVDATITGRRGGFEGTDDFDLRSLAVNVTTNDRANLRMFHKENIGKRLSGVGSWSSGLQSAYRPEVNPSLTRYLEADIYVGDQPMNGGALELGLKSAAGIVWGKMTVNAHADPIGYAHLTFNFLDPIYLSKCTHLYLRQQGKGFDGFTINGITVYSREGQYLGTPHLAVICHELNINAKMAPGITWASRPFLLAEALVFKEK